MRPSKAGTDYYKLIYNPFAMVFKKATDSGNYHHVHEGIEFLYVHHGKGTITIEDQVNNVESGTLVLFLPFQRHHVQMEASADKLYTRSIFVISPEYMDTYLESFPSMRTFLHQLRSGKLPCQIFKAGEWMLMLEHIISDLGRRFWHLHYNEKIEQSALLILSILNMLKNSLLRSDGPEASDLLANVSIEPILDYIEKNFAKDISLDTIAERMNYSKPHASRLFKQKVGSSIPHYIAARRVREACMLLTTTVWDIHYIGEKVGISNIPYFCTVFKKSTGLTPNQYRALNMNKKRNLVTKN